MVKNIFRVLLVAVCLMMSALAVAESPGTEGTYLTYHNETLGYSIDYPEEWIMLSKENFDELLKAVESGEFTIPGIDASTLKQYKEQIESADVATISSQGGSVNCSIFYQPVPSKLTSEDILSNCPAFIQRKQDVLQDYVLQSDSQIEEIGGKEYVVFADRYSSVYGTQVSLQAMLCTDSNLYFITFNLKGIFKEPDLETFRPTADAMLASFVPV